MPFVDFQPAMSTQAPQQAVLQQLLADAAAAVSAKLGKPPEVIMVRVSDPAPMRFADSGEPCCFIDVRGIALQAGPPLAELSDALCGLAGPAFGVEPGRCFVNFIDVPRTHWGLGGRGTLA